VKITQHEIERALAVQGWEFDGLQIFDSAALAQRFYPALDPGQPVLLTALSNWDVADRLSTLLRAAYPPDWIVTLLGPEGDRPAALADLGSTLVLGGEVSVLIPPLPGASSFQALQEIIAHLRAPDGCPWDQALTWAKLRSTLIEEAYELLAALDAEDAPKVAEEQGDLLVQIAMQAQIAVEQGLFRMPDVIGLIVDKLIRRHPHVFGDAVVSGTDEVLAAWEVIKRAERQRNGAAPSPLAGVPLGLPALAQADAYLERMSRLRQESPPESPWAGLTGLTPDETLTAETFGKALFGLVAWGRARGVDAESALREVNAGFAARVAAEGHG
jgi:tetrapyrrole methylase family protein / MazG family protein